MVSRWFGALLGVLLFLAAGPVEAGGALEDDAASGGDAGDGAASAVPIAPNVIHQGNFTLEDGADWYSFEAAAGQFLIAYWRGAADCVTLLDPSLEPIEDWCEYGYFLTSDFALEIRASGTWHFAVEPQVYVVGLGAPQHYRFVFGFDERPCDPFFEDVERLMYYPDEPPCAENS